MFEGYDGFGNGSGHDHGTEFDGLNIRIKADGSRYRYLSYDEIGLAIDKQIDAIDFDVYDGIVVVVRGGSFLGHCVSYRSGLPVYYLEVDREGGYVVRFVNSMVGEGIVRDSRLLVCEDIAGMGYTLTNAVGYLESFGNNVDTFVVCEDSKSRLHADYVLYSSKRAEEEFGVSYRFILPWERYHVSSDYIAGEIKLDDHVYERKVYDSRIRGAVEFGTEERVVDSGVYEVVDLVSGVIDDGRSELGVVEREFVNVYEYLNRDVGFECDSMVDYIGRMGLTDFVTGDYELGLRVARKYGALRVWMWIDGEETPVKVG